MATISRKAAEPPFVLAIDTGTSSSRAVLYDRLGRNIEGVQMQTPYRMHTTPDGGAEIGAEELLDYVKRNLDGVLLIAGNLSEQIAGVATTTFWHNLVGVGRDTLALTPVFSWNDTRSAQSAAELREKLDEAKVHARTGCMLHPAYLPAKLLWLAHSRPDVFRAVDHWMSFGEYIHLRFFGKTFCSLSMASGTGLLDQNRCKWDEEVLSALPISVEQLSPLVDTNNPLTGLRDEFAERWPALKNTPWFPALGDGACSNIGSGCVSNERIALMVGTSGAMRVLWESKNVNIPKGLWCYRADGRRFVMGGALSNGGDLFAWLQNTLRLGSPEDVEVQLSNIEADSHNLTVLPFLSGERSTGWAAHARAAIVGLSMDTRPIHILQAGLESVAYRFARILELLSAEVEEAREIIASGGALLKSPAWTQIMADCLGKPIVTSVEPEASSRGAALLALEALGIIEDIAEAPASMGRAHYPNPERHERYRKAIERQQRLYEALITNPWSAQ